MYYFLFTKDNLAAKDDKVPLKKYTEQKIWKAKGNLRDIRKKPTVCESSGGSRVVVPVLRWVISMLGSMLILGLS